MFYKKKHIVTKDFYKFIDFLLFAIVQILLFRKEQGRKNKTSAEIKSKLIKINAFAITYPFHKKLIAYHKLTILVLAGSVKASMKIGLKANCKQMLEPKSQHSFDNGKTNKRKTNAEIFWLQSNQVYILGRVSTWPKA